MYHTYMQHVTNFRFSSHVSHIIYSLLQIIHTLHLLHVFQIYFKDRNKPIQTYIVLRTQQQKQEKKYR